MDRLPTVLSLLVCGSSALAAETTVRPTGWRGDGTGRFASAQPPTTWSKHSDNIVWKIEPGRGYSSPVLCDAPAGKRIFVTADPSELICIEASSGKVIWRQSAGYAVALGETEAAQIADKYEKLEAEKRAVNKQYNELRKTNPDNPRVAQLKEQRTAIDQKRREFEHQYPPEKRGGAGNAAATVACDGQRVYAVFGTGVVVAFTLEGKRLWIRHLEAPLQGFGHSTSPLLAGGHLIVHLQQITALDTQTGETLWRADVRAQFGSPIAAKVGDEDLVITPSGSLLAAADGRLLAEKQFQLSNNSPLVHDGVLYAHGTGSVKAFRLPKSLAAPFQLDLLWEASGARGQRMASALFHDGLLYAGERRGLMEVIDAATGEEVYRERLEIGELFSSPTLAGGLIYFGGKDGQTLVLRPGREFESVATNQTDRYSTTPVFNGGRMYLRTDKYLYCIGD